MDGREKSDAAIVAMKPTNNFLDNQGGGAGGANGGGPKGTRASKVRAGRTSGKGVSQALNRVREVARQPH